MDILVEGYVKALLERYADPIMQGIAKIDIYVTLALLRPNIDIVLNWQRM